MVKASHTERDKAILLFLADTGVRRTELVMLNMQDIKLFLGSVEVRHGKGGKVRPVYMGARAKRQLKKYLKTRADLRIEAPLFATFEETRLTPAGLRQIIRRRAADAGIPEPGLHDFCRCFAVQMLRNGCDLVSLCRLMGHSSIMTTQRYLALVEDDLREGQGRASPVDKAYYLFIQIK